VRDFAEFAGLDPPLELLPDSGIRGISHAARQRRSNNRAVVFDSRSLEDMIARPGHGPLRLHLRLPQMVLTTFARLGDYEVRLMPALGSKLAVPLYDFSWRQQFLAVACMVGRDLRCRSSVDSLFSEMVFDLFTSWTGSLQIFLRVASDFRLRLRLKTDSGRTVELDPRKHLHLDHGYAMTSHSSQGQTADRVLIHVDTELGAKELLNSRMAYVSVSRGRSDAQIYTDNASTLGQELSRDVSHSPAIQQEQAAHKIEPQTTHTNEIVHGFGLGL